MHFSVCFESLVAEVILVSPLPHKIPGVFPSRARHQLSALGRGGPIVFSPLVFAPRVSDPP